MKPSGALSDGVAIACQARLAVAVVRSCTGSVCAPAKIGDMLQNPESYFRRDGELPASLCWETAAGNTIYRKMPERAAAFREQARPMMHTWKRYFGWGSLQIAITLGLLFYVNPGLQLAWGRFLPTPGGAPRLAISLIPGTWT